MPLITAAFCALLAQPAQAGSNAADAGAPATEMTALTPPTFQKGHGLTLVDAGWHYGAGALTTGVTTPLTFLLAAKLGSQGHSLHFVLPAFLSAALLPPLFTTLGQWLWGNHQKPGSAKLWPSAAAALGVHVLVITAAIWAGATVQAPGEMALITLADMLLMPAAVTAIYALQYPSAGQGQPSAPPQPQQSASLLMEGRSQHLSFAPRQTILPLVKVSF